ncbi:actin cytoskeleton-regulatory complex protein PAN1-like isoform X2 [Lycium ferocissimum]|uniref:actin cytoskeleton-regulatory complex protein PAN1-like isoform X2 n=1 Tax=Lycium ferocissimum TaxID=112874 RepID=UPI002814D4A2|nr:actin cytoskeleton-regulatory complex protein PAN1-like isoform X2 [Lycium ferocissimum]
MSMDQFELYFRRADLDQDGRISGPEAVAFLKGSNLPQPVLAQIWTYADQSRTGFLSRQEFYNALKLVTVAQKRELTPEIVKAALFTPASAKIPPPQINLAAIPGPQPTNKAGAAVPPVSGATPTAPQTFGIRGQQGLPAQQSHYVRPPRPSNPSPGFQSQPNVSGQGMLAGSTIAASRPPSSTDLLAGQNGGSQAGASSQAYNTSVSSRSEDAFGLAVLTPSAQQTQLATTPSVQPDLSKSNDATLSHGNLPDAKVPKPIPVAGNGLPSDSLFGDVFSVASVQPKQSSAPTLSSGSSLAVPLATDRASTGSQPPVKANSVDSQTTLPQQPVHQHQQAPLTVRPNQQVPVQSSAANPSAARNSLPGQSQLPWPRITQSDYQKYSKVFMAVDTDRDGKITGAEARSLFLSWKLPREVLKQVWDLSDQDNDSMLSLREFCIALYLMERHREGRPLPSVLPTNLIFDASPLRASGQPTGSHGVTAWRDTPGLQQTQGPSGARQAASGAPRKPPRPVPIPQPDEDVQPSKQKPKVPVLEKHLIDQLSTEEQGSLNTKFQEATDAEKKVMELEKDILDAKEKIQFYHAKMQEIILYKSRCDNRLNEITERTSADKREVELLAKKYEEKYKQTGDVASKLTIEEATFRDIQEKKMELYKTVVKMDQDGKTDGIQDRANQIQADLEGLVKALNERCKTYGLRAKPTTLLELPFGWQPGIQEGAADWDGEWDKLDDEEFTFVKELTLDVQNVVAPPKPKSSLVRDKASSLNDHDTGKSSADADTDTKAEKLPNPVKAREMADAETSHAARSPTDSPTRSNAVNSPSKEFEESPNRKDSAFDGSPHAAQSEHWGAESVFSGDKSFDESGWGTFDKDRDADAAWDFNSGAKDSRDEKHKETSLFDDDDWGLKPIKTGSTNSSNSLPKQTPFFDSVPSTPNHNTGFSYSENQFPKQSPFFDSVPSTPSYNSGFPQGDNLFSRQSPFFDSVPSTPAYNAGGSPVADNMFQKRSLFADSVPGTPMSEDHLNSFSRYDSFNMHDGGLFGSREFSRFDSMRSTRDSEYDNGSFQQRDSFTRFDSFRSTADSDYNFGAFPPPESLSRFDSFRSTRDTDYGHGSPSFDDADPFGSHERFKTSVESKTPKRDSDNWKAF